MTFSEIAAARKAKYNATFSAPDSFGRMITIMRLKPSQQARVRELCPGLSGTDKITVVDKETGKPEEREMSRNYIMMLAASVRMIDEAPHVFPKTRADLDYMLDLLDEEGLIAASDAMLKAAIADADIDVVGEAKNAVPTQA